MAQGTGEFGSSVTADVEAIRAEMAQTRAALAQKLGMLKSRVFGNPARRKGKKGTMTQKKDKAVASSKKKSTAKKAVGKAVTKTKKVLSKMLAGAAVGAVKGATEAVLPDADSSEKNTQSEK